MSTYSKLPEKPSQLIRLAINDLIKCEKDKDNYEINMHYWHVGKGNKLWNDISKQTKTAHCIVCFAGSVLAQTIKIDLNITCGIEGGMVTQGNSNALFALDLFRKGHVVYACKILGCQTCLDNIDIIDYKFDPVLFKKQMRTMARKLQAEGN